MKVLLLRPFIELNCGIFPPISLMYLSSYLKSKAIDVKLMDNCVDLKYISDFSNKNSYIKDLVNNVAKIKPDIIGMTLFSKELKEIYHVSKLIKEALPNAYIVLGGPHPTAMPENTLDLIPYCDFVVRGEAEIIFHELIVALGSGNNFDKVKGISFRAKNDTNYFSTEPASIINDIDSIPFPDRESLLENYKKGTYSSFLFGNPTDNIISSRGCAFQCSFCSKVCVKYRSRSPENVINEIDWVINNINPKLIQIMDDSFTLEKKRCISILDMMTEKQYKCNFRVRSRVDAVDDELLKKMKRAGVNAVVYGFESGSQEMLNTFNKRTTVEKNILACELTKKNGITCLGDIMLFYPGETLETLKETELFIKKAKPAFVQLHLLTPLPKTKVYEEAKENGTMIGEWDLRGETPWIKIKGFESLEIMENYIKKMRFKIYFQPRVIWTSIITFGLVLAKNPIFSLKMIIHNLIRKAKY